MTRVIRVLGGKGCWGILILSFCLWEVLAKDIPFDTNLVYWHLEQQLNYGSGIRYIRNYCITWVLGIGTCAVVVELVFEVWVVYLSHGTMI